MEVLATATRQEEKVKAIQTGKKKVKLSLFADDIIETPKESTKKLLELINEFRRLPEYKINIHKSVALLYTNNELPENEI